MHEDVRGHLNPPVSLLLSFYACTSESCDKPHDEGSPEECLGEYKIELLHDKHWFLVVQAALFLS